MPVSHRSFTFELNGVLVLGRPLRSSDFQVCYFYNLTCILCMEIIIEIIQGRKIHLMYIHKMR